MIPAGEQIGLLGGGQLGTFFTIAAKRLGYQVMVWDPDPRAPAHAWADTSLKSDFQNPAALQTFLNKNAVITFEWENIPVDLVTKIEAKRPVYPGSDILSLLQNRIQEKTFLSSHGFPVTPYRAVLKPEDLKKQVKQMNLPLICKTATAGYDGQGQWRLTNTSEVGSLMNTLEPRKTGWVIEQVAPFIKELSILAARNASGEVVTYPVTENSHERGILRLCRIPAEIATALSEKISTLAVDVLSALQGVGLFCIELFLLENDELLINEIAPRPHNSGHYTLDVASPSQYEQQVRAICGLPLQKPVILSPAVMVNVLGSEISALRKNPLRQKLLSMTGVSLYDYRKEEIKDRRKMGHVTLIGSDPNALLARAEEVREILEKTQNQINRC